jgi:DNA-directed RNA polymerase specialized sigma24 family protein
VAAEAELEEVVSSAVGGDGRAWERLVERYAGLVWSVARSYALAVAVAAEVAQTCWLRLTESLAEVPAGDVGAWLCGEARKEALHALRWHDPRWDAVPRARQSAELAVALDQLPTRSRVAVEVAALPGITPEELAAAVGLPVPAAEELAARTRKQLGLEHSDVMVTPEPVPAPVLAGAVAAYSWRGVGDGTGPSYDSLLDEQLTVRSSSGARLLSFTWAGRELDLEVSVAGTRRSLLGQLTPGGPGSVLVRHGGEYELVAELDSAGRFAVPDLAPGALSVHVDDVRTAWVLV